MPAPPTHPHESYATHSALEEGTAAACQEEEESDEPNTFSPSHKMLSLLLCCTMMIGLYYLMSMPASIRQHLKDAMRRDDFESMFQLLLSLNHLQIFHSHFSHPCKQELPITLHTLFGNNPKL